MLHNIFRLLQLEGLEKSFYSFYVCTAVRKFFFFLDPMRKGTSRGVCMFFKGHLPLGTLFPRGPSGFFTIEIINNTRGGIEGKIGERGVWGGKFKSRMFTHSRCPRQKKSF